MMLLRLDDGDVVRQDSVICLGFFDGVHLGHQSLIRQAVAVGAEKGLAVCVHTFDRMPQRALRPQAAIIELTPLAEKAALLEAQGVDVLAVSRFEAPLIQMSAEAFFHRILVQALRARHVVAGFHHRFGHRGEGDADRLQRLCEEQNIGLSIMPPVRLTDGTLVSSTAIREALASGDDNYAARMLGRDIIRANRP